MLRALIVDTGRKITPFLEPPWDAAYAGKTIGDDIKDALARRGVSIVDESEARAGQEPVLVLADHTFVSDKCLGDFLDASLDLTGSAPLTRLALARTPSVDFLRPVSSVSVEPFDASGPGARPQKGWDVEVNAKERVAYDCFLAKDGAALPGESGADLLAALREKAQRVVVTKRELGIPMRMPTLGDVRETASVVPITSTVAGHIEHWVHILWLNQLAFGVRWMEIARREKAWMFWRALCAFPWFPFARFFASFVKKGRGVRIHPTAHVEASILGDGVVIGARASVRNSILGDGVEVGDHGTVISSSLGARTYVTPRTFMVWGATYADAVITNYKLQVSLVGRKAALSTWAGLIDAKLQGEVEVKHDGKLVSTERSFIGSCIGHGAYVGAKVLIMPGREIPNGTFIAMRPDELITNVPRELPAGVPLVRDQGTLVPLDKLLPPSSSSSSR